MKDKMIGKIKWYKENKGYGYIIGSDDETYFFELINCVNPKDIFMPGDDVKFVPNYSSTEYATQVERAAIVNE